MLRAAHGRPVGGGRPVLQSNIFDFYMCTLSITPRFRHPPPQVPRFRVPRVARCGGRGSGGSRFRVPALPRASGVGSQRTKGVLNCGQVPRFQVPRGARNPARGRSCSEPERQAPPCCTHILSLVRTHRHTSPRVLPRSRRALAPRKPHARRSHTNPRPARLPGALSPRTARR